MIHAQETLRFRACEQRRLCSCSSRQAAVDATENPEGEVGETAVCTVVKGSPAQNITNPIDPNHII